MRRKLFIKEKFPNKYNKFNENFQRKFMKKSFSTIRENLLREGHKAKVVVKVNFHYVFFFIKARKM